METPTMPTALADTEAEEQRAPVAGPSPSTEVGKRGPPPATNAKVTPEKEKKKGQQPMTSFFTPLLNPRKYLKNMEGVPYAKNFLQDDLVVVHGFSVANGLFYVVKLDGYGTNVAASQQKLKPLYNALGMLESNGKDTRDAKMLAFARKAGVVCVAPRRKNKSEDLPILRATAAKGKPMEKEAVFVAVLREDTKESKLSLMNLVVQYLNSRGVLAEVSYHADRTDPERQSLDHYLTDSSIVRLLEYQWKDKVTRDFYETNVEARDAIFTPPYSKVANLMLGYPYVKIEKLPPLPSEGGSSEGAQVIDLTASVDGEDNGCNNNGDVSEKKS